MNEHDDVIETKAIKIRPLQSFLANSVPESTLQMPTASLQHPFCYKWNTIR